jgi:hypothetical protein
VHKTFIEPPCFSVCTERAIVSACPNVCGFAYLTCLPGTPIKPDTKLASSIRLAVSWWMRLATGSSTLQIILCANALHRSANSWGLSFFFFLAVCRFVKWNGSVWTSFNLFLNASLKFSHVILVRAVPSSYCRIFGLHPRVSKLPALVCPIHAIFLFGLSFL